MKTSRVFLGLLALSLVHRVAVADWPQLLGPTQDAVYAGPALLESWPKEGPRVAWSAEVGEGYSSPVVASNRLIVTHRLNDELIVDCLDAMTGAKQWRFTHAMKFKDGAYMDHGPRPTPTIQGGRVFVHNSDGYLVCLNLADGRKVWSREAKSEFKSSATWHGACASPLVTERAVILPVGATNAGVVAFDVATGKTLWSVLDDKATASSPVLASLHGRAQVLVHTRTALRSLNPANGETLWSFTTGKQTSGDVYCANPIVVGDNLFLSGWYRLGAHWLDVKSGKPEVIWKSDQALSTHYAAAVIHEGHAYGYHGHAWERGGPTLRCIDLATGKMVWEQPQNGSGTIVKCGRHLLILTDTGELQMAVASPKEFKIISRAQVLGRNNRSYPAVANGFVYARGQKKLVALDLRTAK